MQDFIFHNPTKIVFGKNKTSRIGQEAAAHGKRVLLLYGGGSVKRAGILDKVTESLKAAGIEWIECGGIKSNPVLGFVRKAIELYRRENLEAIVAVGGGSVIDTGKAVAAGVRYDGDVWDFFVDKARIKDAAPLIVVLTLAATASEMNCVAVITNEEMLQKFRIRNESLFPKVSILDPVNTFSVPMDYSMYGAIDAVIHILEGYFNCSDKRTPIQDRMVEGLVKTIMEISGQIREQPDHYDARADMMWSATLCLNGITSAGIGPTGFPMHMIAHSLSAIYDIAHGASLSIVAPAWMTWQSRQSPEKYAQLAERVFHLFEGTAIERARAGIESLTKWYVSLGSPVTFDEVDIPETDVRMIAENAHMHARHWGLTAYSVDVIQEILMLVAAPPKP